MMNTTISAKAQQGCQQYLELLAHWNKVHNLTALRDRQTMQQQLIDQSLLLLPHLVGRVVDLGTGAGIPGIPLAIARPDMSFTLIDSRTKKTVFLQQVVSTLGLTNVRVVNTRMEDCQLEPFDTLVCRALGSLSYIDTVSAKLRHKDSRLLCVRGAFDAAELNDTSLRMTDCITLSTDRQNNLVIMTP